MQDQPKQRSIESYGLGQSGYTAGRIEGDRALGIEARNLRSPRRAPPEADELGVDERWTGTGGIHWAPDGEPPAPSRVEKDTTHR
jgi:hypothetical protein